VHYDQLGVRDPDACLEIGSGTHAAQTGAILAACEAWLLQHRPGLAVVIGDTNSTLACALAAVKLGIPVAHVEAGMRAGDRYMAEEINRRVVDAVAELLFAPCERVARLLRQQWPDAQVETVGDVAFDVLRRALPRVPPPATVTGYDPAWGGDFVYATLHRAELVDVPERLSGVLQALGRSPLPCLFAAHPRTKAALAQLRYVPPPGVRLVEPMGYLDNIALVRHARAVVTDSGGLQREAYWLGVPCLTVREETEWLETVECGANRLIAPEQASALPGALGQIATLRASWDRGAYGDGHAAERIADVLKQRFQGLVSSSR
jgi:UDP-N-acetylglucosamine 2-epimerase